MLAWGDMPRGQRIEARQSAQQLPHPCGQHREALDQILPDGRPVHGLSKDFVEPLQDAIPVGAQRVLEPVQRLHHPHGGPPGPIEAAGRRLLELDDEVVELDRTPPRIGVDGHTRRHGVGHAQIVRGGHAIDQHAQLIPARDGIEHGAVVGRRGPFGQAVDHRPVVQPPVDPAQLARQRQALQRLVYRVTTAQRGEVGGRPDAAGRSGGHHRGDLGFEIGHV